MAADKTKRDWYIISDGTTLILDKLEGLSITQATKKMKAAKIKGSLVRIDHYNECLAFKIEQDNDKWL